MTKQALSNYIFTGKYANWNSKEGRREVKSEARARKFDMHRRKYAELVPWTQEGLAKHVNDNHYKFISADTMMLMDTAARERLVLELINGSEEDFAEDRVLGSQRALQYGGRAVERQNSKLYNCTSSYCDRGRFFQEAFHLLLCGSGVGFSVQWDHIKGLPRITKPMGEFIEYVADDSIEGWADSAGVLISSFCMDEKDAPFPEYVGKRVIFNLEGIRPEGADLSSGVGKAPGPDPLRRCLKIVGEHLENVCARLDAPLQEETPAASFALHANRQMQPIDAYDIVMHLSDAVLSGGVRRSAAIVLFSVDDNAMMAAKTGNWFMDNPQRGRSNNSAVLVRGQVTKEQFMKLFDCVKEFGEPGFYWVNSINHTTNPCVEISFFPMLPDGRTGWQSCNLSTINIAACNSEEDFLSACRSAAIIGTIQAGYTSFPYLGEVSEELARREALLGVSMTGMAERPWIVNDEDLLRRGAEVVLRTNEEVSLLIGIRPAARATCVKPEGTSSAYLGTSSGIHGHHARRYFRNVQANHLEPQMLHYQKHNPGAIETSVWNTSGTDKVVTFLIETEEGAQTREDLYGIEMLKHVLTVKKAWVDTGRVPERCVDPTLSHNVSNTVTIKSDENHDGWQEAADYIYDNRADISGISLLAHSGDLDYPQAPFIAILAEEDILAKYGAGAFMASGLIVDALRVFPNLWAACDVVLGKGEDLKEQRHAIDVAAMKAKFSQMSEENKESTKSLLDKMLDVYKEVDDDEDGHALIAFANILDHSGGTDMIASDAGLGENSKERALAHKEDWHRRADQFADRYFVSKRDMTECLKHVHNLKRWQDLSRTFVDVDYREIDNDSADDIKIQETVACAGGACDRL